jgi:hypothetical protein
MRFSARAARGGGEAKRSPTALLWVALVGSARLAQVTFAGAATMTLPPFGPTFSPDPWQAS